MKKIKKLIKRFVSYTIEDDIRIYRLKHTPVKVTWPLTRRFLAKYGALPVKPDKIVIDNYMGQGYGWNPQYVAEALAGSPYELVWIVKDAALRRDGFPAGVRLVEYLSEEALYEYATAGIWLCNYHLIAYFNRGLVKKPGQIYIQMWHGSFGIKKIENDCGILTGNKSWYYLAQKNAAATDYWISNSGFETEVYKSAFWGAGPVLEYGHPRNDVFFRKDAAALAGKVSRALGISQEERVFLYVPTFRERGQSSVAALDVGLLLRTLRESRLAASGVVRCEKKARGKETLRDTQEHSGTGIFPEAAAWRIVVRFHPRMERAQREAFLRKWPSVVDATAYPDIQELLVRADAAMTDYSSCLFDYLLSGRPGFLFVPDRREYDEERGFYYSLEESPFPVAETNGELEQKISSFDRQTYADRVRDFLTQKRPAEDGRAAERVAALIRRTVEGKKEGI